eukprot:m.30470 g.30470  ORF g.30470 m.30470 type:complete len:141 (-) comp8204_c0_seq2:2594-3016(-)
MNFPPISFEVNSTFPCSILATEAGWNGSETFNCSVGIDGKGSPAWKFNKVTTAAFLSGVINSGVSTRDIDVETGTSTFPISSTMDANIDLSVSLRGLNKKVVSCNQGLCIHIPVIHHTHVVKACVSTHLFPSVLRVWLNQ